MTETEAGRQAGEEPDGVPPRAAGDGKIRRAAGNRRKQKTRGAGPGRKKAAGAHPGSAVTQAIGILRSEGYTVARMAGRELPFDLMASRDHRVALVRVVRAREPVTDARGAMRIYAGVLAAIMPLWHSDEDDHQIMILSRKSGPLRYNVFRGGIWNTETRETARHTVPEPAGACINCPLMRSRTAAGTGGETGAVPAPAGAA